MIEYVSRDFHARHDLRRAGNKVPDLLACRPSFVTSLVDVQFLKIHKQSLFNAIKSTRRRDSLSP